MLRAMQVKVIIFVKVLSQKTQRNQYFFKENISSYDIFLISYICIFSDIKINFLVSDYYFLESFTEYMEREVGDF